MKTFMELCFGSWTYNQMVTHLPLFKRHHVLLSSRQFESKTTFREIKYRAPRFCEKEPTCWYVI